MRRQGTGIGLLTASLLAFVGCHSEPYLRPPKPPEALVAPPIEEVRFSQPPEYPKNLLNEDHIKKPNGAGKDAGDPNSMPHNGMNRPGGPTPGGT
jgi:hypothetical protein